MVWVCGQLVNDYDYYQDYDEHDNVVRGVDFDWRCGALGPMRRDRVDGPYCVRERVYLHCAK